MKAVGEHQLAFDSEAELFEHALRAAVFRHHGRFNLGVRSKFESCWADDAYEELRPRAIQEPLVLLEAR